MMKIFSLIIFLSSYSLFASEALVEHKDFGENQGHLKMFTYQPQANLKGAIVLLHGCAQGATDFDDESGWIDVARKQSLLLIFVEQTRLNNSFRCFNWFLPHDLKRGSGEVSSIADMVSYARSKYDLKNFYIMGLSAGGAMANAALAAYPELFKAGALVAGIPLGCASNSYNAWSCMAGQQIPLPTQKQRGDAIRKASQGFQGSWPSVMIIQGTADEIVSPKNADFLSEQWMNIHRNESNVKRVNLEGIRHGMPIDPTNGCGQSERYIIDSNYCAASKIVDFFLSK